MVAVLENKRDAIAALCRKYGVLRLYVFGSVLSEGFRPRESDVDMLDKRRGCSAPMSIS
jgi:predicted nucleotidyltransferase